MARYVEQTAKKVARRPTTRHAKYPWLIGSVDREILGDERGPGVLETKTANTHVFAKFRREGLSTGYILQMATYLFIRGRAWGAFAILQPDSWAFETFEVTRDDALVEPLLPEIEATWRMVEHGPLPAALDPADRRCQVCAFRRTCHGGELGKPLSDEERRDVLEVDDDLAALVADYVDAKELADDAGATFDAVKDELRRRLGARQAVEAGGYRVYYRQQKDSQMLDIELVRAQRPELLRELLEKYSKVRKGARPLRLYAT